MKHKKTMIIGVIVLAISFIMIALFNSTYALFSSDDYAKVPENFSTGLLQIEILSKSENISLNNALPISDDDGLLTEPYVFTIKNVGNLNYLFDVKLLSTGTSDTTFLPQYIKVQIDDGDVMTLADLTGGVIKDDITLNVGESIDVSLRVWLSIETPNTELGKSFDSKIVTDGQAIYTESNYNITTFADYISNLYRADTKKSVLNDNITYSYGTSSDLMIDKLGGTLEYDGGNIRYYGKTPDNYVYFNCDDYNNQTSDTCELWRIIGVFDGKVKLVRDTPIGSYTWDYNADGTYDNDWTSSTLMNLLNDGYYNNKDGITYYNYDSTTKAPSEVTVNFATSGIGIKNTDTRELISDHEWVLTKGGESIAIYPGYAYNYEMGNNSYTADSPKWTGKIGLMYGSDYGYGADFSVCDTTLNLYDDSNCTSTNWLSKGKYTWLLPTHFGTYYVWYINASSTGIGRIYPGGYVNRNYSVYPTLFLEENTIKVTGRGTNSDPYQIKYYDVNGYRGNAAEYITSLYTSNNPTEIIEYREDGVTEVARYYYSYMDEGSTWGLMNDGLGATVTDTTALINATQGNIRYYGATPDNYIYFNCDDYSNQSSSTCELWRIIGVFDGKVKIVKDDKLINSSYDCDSEGNISANWHEATLMTTLNDYYYNNKDGAIYYYTFAGDFDGYEDFINFKKDNIGIKNDDTRSLIADNIWYLGGFNEYIDEDVYASLDIVYASERGSEYSAANYEPWSGKIALVYASDVGYTSDLSKCSIGFPEGEMCLNMSWLSGNLVVGNPYLLMPSGYDYLYFYDKYGYFERTGSGPGEDYHIFPTLYLEPELGLRINGDGSENNPYQIYVE